MARPEPAAARRTLCRKGDRPADPPLAPQAPRGTQRHGAIRGVFRYKAVTYASNIYGAFGRVG
jgi:hypothetical protein